MKMGVEVLLSSKDLQKKYSSLRAGWLCHAASVDKDLNHTLDHAVQNSQLNVTAAFGPQHGIRAEKQDNMIESRDFIHPEYKIPIFSLYGEYRRPTQDMLNAIDVLFVDLQDVGCRIYTFLTTLFYCIEAAAELGKKIVVLDRPNPAGRPIEGNKLDMNFESFIGAAPIPMRHGLTLGEAGNWYIKNKKLNVDFEVIKMESYKPKAWGKMDWPNDYSWVNPSPNIPRVSCTQTYPGTVLLEGTFISEGRGTTLPLEMFGAPMIDPKKLLAKMESLFPDLQKHCVIRPCYFEPTFHKHMQKVCGGLQIHVDIPKYNPEGFKPYRTIAVFLKSVSMLYPDFVIWKNPPYEYEYVKLPIDILSGGPQLRNWVEDKTATFNDFENFLIHDEKEWTIETKEYYLY